MRDGCGETHQIILGLADESFSNRLDAPSIIICATESAAHLMTSSRASRA
jgi:hypothetical protein